ncbi:GNAT family N-acetyltransferase [Candidatus Bathyarchaeota archaeon]|jgi:GNAT superfamily N-acetyltransferase|nr:GNAT family N-acetyltransferase [Candidatus Bathyarchaeota archaeon]
MKTSERHMRSYAPEGLMVLRGPGEEYDKGSHWVVGDGHGYAEGLLMKDRDAIHPNTFYVENIIVKELKRGNGHGRALYAMVEEFARNVGAEWIQIDSEPEAVGFWRKMDYTELDRVFYKNKTAMVKKL